MPRLAAVLCLALLVPALPAHAGGHAPAHHAAAHAAAPAAARVNPKMARDVRHLLKLSGAADLGMMVLHRLIHTFSRMMPNVPQRFWTTFQKQVHPSELIDLMVPIYARHLSHAEVHALIRFYESKTGRTLVKALPAITAESQAAGQQWGMKIAQKAMVELKAKGYHR